MDISSVIDIVTQLVGSFKSANLAAIGYAHFITFYILALFGVIAHVVVDIRKGTLKPSGGSGFLGTLFTYLFKDNFFATVKMAASVVTLSYTYFASATQPLSWAVLLLAAILSGYTSDSVFNRGATPPAV